MTTRIMSYNKNAMKNNLRRILKFAALSLFIGINVAHAAIVPVTTAFYSDSLQSGINPGATSFTLVKGIDGEGASLNGTYGFVIDQGTASQEIFYCLTVVGTNASNCTPGVDLTNGTTTVTALENRHNRGAAVQITTAPIINIIANILRGIETIAQPIAYSSSVSTSTLALNPGNVANVAFVQSAIFAPAGIINAATTNKGIVQIATPSQVALSTSVGSTGALLVVPSSNATTTYNPATATSVIPVTGSDGKISNNFIATSTTGSQVGLFATSSIYASPIGMLGKNMQVFSSVGTSTFAVPTGVSTVCLEGTGAGAGGRGSGSTNTGEPGSGSGGFFEGCVNVSATTSVQVFIGTGGTGVGASTANPGGWTTFGTNGFYASAQGGVGPSTGGTASFTGGLAFTGNPGDFGVSVSGSSVGGVGGYSLFGGQSYGFGGNGAANNSGSSGGNGLLVVFW